MLRYGYATILVLAASVFRIGLSAVFNRPWISAPLFLLAIIMATWAGGLRLGVYASLISGLVLDYFFVQPLVGSLSMFDRIVRIGLFLGEGSLVGYLIEKLRRAGDGMAASREEMRRLSEYQRTNRDEELKSISREIHDELGQALTSLKLHIHFLRCQLWQEVNDRLKNNLISGLDDLSRQVEETIDSVRRISSELRPSLLDDFGLVAALEWQAKEFERKSSVRCTFRSDSDSIDLDTEIVTAFYRIAQEALTNVARHAEASAVLVSIGKMNGQIVLQIADDGRGIELAEITGLRSLGILGMRERARLIGAHLTVSRPEIGGTIVEVVVNSPKGLIESC